MGVGHQDAEGVGDLFLVGAAADIEEVGGAAAGVLDDVHGGHGEAGAVDHAADIAVELDVIEAEFRGFDLEGIFLMDIPEGGDIGVAVEGVVVKIEFGVEGDDALIFGDDEGVDFGERGVGFDRCAGERLEEPGGGRGGGAGESDAEGEVAGLEGEQAAAGIERLFQDEFGGFGGDLLDVHAAGGGGHEDGEGVGAVEDDAGVEFFGDGEGLLDEDAADEAAFGAGLVGDEGHAEDAGGDGFGLGGGGGELDAAALAAAAGVDLGLDDDGGTDFFGDGAGLSSGGGDAAARDGDAVAREDLLGLVFVDFHGVGVVVGSGKSLVFQYNMPFLSYLHKVMEREPLSTEEAMEAMEEILGGRATTAQIAAFLAAMRVKGETADELLGLAQAMREHAVRVEHGITDRVVLDTCGTGGDQSGTFNISTAVAFVAAACGVAVAKHGNRSMSSRCGSADVVEALGAKLLMEAGQMARCIRETGIGFLYAPALHPAMKHAAPARAELKTRTVMNLLGPLTNPAGATAQLVGAPSLRAAELMAVTLASLGLERGYVVHGEDGLDEVTTTAETHLMGIVHGAIEHEVVRPESFGVKRARMEELQGGDAEENARILVEVLEGRRGPKRDIVLVNAGVALRAAGVAETFEEGMQKAAEAIDGGAAREKLRGFVEFTRRAAG